MLDNLLKRLLDNVIEIEVRNPHEERLKDFMECRWDDPRLNRVMYIIRDQPDGWCSAEITKEQYEYLAGLE